MDNKLSGKGAGVSFCHSYLIYKHALALEVIQIIYLGDTEAFNY